MNVRKLAMALGATDGVPAALESAAKRFEIVMVDHWLAQMYVESAGFKRTKENLNYRPDRLLAVFPGRNGLRTIEQARSIIASGQVGEAVYGMPWGERLGNTRPGDGQKFIGRGYKQLTGRDNYRRYSLAMYGDSRIVDAPEMLEQLPDAALSAGWFWRVNSIDRCGDDLEAVTRKVNGGLNGLAQRRDALARVRRVR